jgi:hypothetical protein
LEAARGRRRSWYDVRPGMGWGVLMQAFLRAAHRDERGEFNFVTALLVLGLAAAGYFAFVYVPPWLDHFTIKKAVRTGANMAYSVRTDGAVRSVIHQGFQEAAIQNQEIAKDGSVIKRPLRVEEQTISVSFSESPAPSVSVEVAYSRKLVLPLFKKERTLEYRVAHTEDLSPIKY